MLTELLYQIDSYLKEFDAKVIEIRGKSVMLDRTAFHPLSGGLDSDRGVIRCSSQEYNVLQVSLESEEKVWHELDVVPKFSVGDKVVGLIDWDKRYRMMKLHTASHILSSIMFNRHGALITGGHIDAEHARDDFSLQSSDKAVFEEAVEETNNIIQKGLDVKIYFLERDEALKIPGIIKLAQRTPPNVRLLRIVEILGVDIQADGGPHVRNTREIGGIVLEKVENKGKGRKRIYYRLR
ncbi:MAG: alanyl-tRNA editing protein [Thaumarchaeota archaeon]|jgi:misacylated tRNA(Ala) deacylase|nr:alanyl-tRNA editing protein [Candidatus Terraquivivens yellowstonensis]